MQVEQRYWFPKYEEDKKIVVDLKAGKIISANPILVTSASELLTLMLVTSGFDHQIISSILDHSKSTIADNMYDLRISNHTENGNLYRKATTLGLLNPLALRGLAVRIWDHEKRDMLLEQIDAATEALNENLLKESGKKPYAIPSIKKQMQNGVFVYYINY